MALSKQEVREFVRERVAPANAERVVPLRRGLPDIVLPNIHARLEAESGILWAEMQHPERACFTPALMHDGRLFQEHLTRLYGHDDATPPFRYLAWTSRARGAWSLGGDLTTFVTLIRRQDRAGLAAYARRAIDVLYDNYRALDLPVLTVAVIEGDAIGGGFEAMLTNDIVIAERGTKFGLPEILFNLFPGMGAYSFLRRRVGEARARALIEDGRSRSAEEMHELGLVHHLVDRGEARETLRRIARERAAAFRTDLTLARVRRRVDALTREELDDVVDMWVDLALGLSDSDLRRMEVLARHQQRKRAA